MPRPNGDEDGNAGALPAPACPRHRGYSGGGKLPSPTVRLMRHACHQAEPEQTGCGNIKNETNKERGRAEEGGRDFYLKKNIKREGGWEEKRRG